MSKNLEKRGALESKFEGVDEEAHEDLADDLIFEPSLAYEGRKVAIAIKDGVQVCWNCHEPVTPSEAIDALMGDGVVVRLCEEADCRKNVGQANRERREADLAGKIIRLDNLTDEQRAEVVAEVKEMKKKFRN